MANNDIEVRVQTADAGTQIGETAEVGPLKTVIISGTFTTGTVTLQARKRRGYAPVTGGAFTEIGVHSNLVEDVTTYRLDVSNDFTGDIWVELM